MLQCVAAGRVSGDYPENAQLVIPSLHGSCYFCASFLCRLKSESGLNYFICDDLCQALELLISLM